MGVVTPGVGVSGSTATYTYCDLETFRATPISCARVGGSNPSSLIGLRRSVGFGLVDWVDCG